MPLMSYKNERFNYIKDLRVKTIIGSLIGKKGKQEVSIDLNFPLM
jgi:hypothetical protein